MLNETEAGRFYDYLIKLKLNERKLQPQWQGVD
jgi:hypothetical protein